MWLVVVVCLWVDRVLSVQMDNSNMMPLPTTDVKEGGGRELQESDLKRLRVWNVLAAVLHLIQGCVMVAVAGTYHTSVLVLCVDLNAHTHTDRYPTFGDFTTPITRSTLHYNDTSPEGARKFYSKVNEIATVPVAPFVATFFFLSAAFQAATALPWCGLSDTYRRGVREGLNVFRWYKYRMR